VGFISIKRHLFSSVEMMAKIRFRNGYYSREKFIEEISLNIFVFNGNIFIPF
jgi:hypothetical protein